MTGDAVGLEDLTRWLGVVIAFVGALAVNPDATAHVMRTIRDGARRISRQTRGFFARFIPWLRRGATVHGVMAGTLPSITGHFTGYARGVAGWGPNASTAERIDVLDRRTLALDKEVGELQQKVDKVEQRLRDELTDAVATLRGEAVEIREAVDEVKRDTIQLDASALPIIVLGVVLGGLAPDAARVPLGVWLLCIAAAVAFTIRRTLVIFRNWRAASVVAVAQ